MTGYGKASARVEGKQIVAEIRCLNSKGLDLGVRLPSRYKSIEQSVRKAAEEMLVRGKIEIGLSMSGIDDTQKVVFDKVKIKSYYAELKKIAKDTGELNTPLLPLLIQMPGVFDFSEQEAGEKESDEVRTVILKALEHVKQFRIKEGKLLGKDILSHVTEMEKRLKLVEEKDKFRAGKLKEKMKSRLAENLQGAELDNNRFEQEMLYYLEKLDINEEKIRLAGHFTHFYEAAREEFCGRKLAFISQEIGREINTIGSKANDGEMQKIVVEMKDELEKVKEQLLNVL
jgi:uncharacterized protein (TIGR00255 family)